MVPGSPDTVVRRRWIALLAAGHGAVLSFDTAARIQRVSTVPATGPTVVTVAHSGWQRLDGVVVHQLDDLADDHLEMIDGMPVTTPARTIVDLSAIWRRGRLGIAIEDLTSAKRITLPEIGACLQSVARRGKPG